MSPDPTSERQVGTGAVRDAAQPAPAPAVAAAAAAAAAYPGPDSGTQPSPDPTSERQLGTAPAPAAAEKPAAAQAAKPTPAAAKPAAAAAEPGLRPATRKQWAYASVLVALAVIGAATIVVAIARWIAGLEPVAAFIAQYPGTYALPDGAPIGLPVWLNWSHFFNFLLLALIVRSGLQVRGERKPPAYFTSKRSGAKVSLTVWLHTSVDILWVVNGVLFVVLLFATGQWMRIVPTSWEVFPHAISAALQYATLDWPLEDGWVNYNSLQQLAYFATVFIATPIAIATGVRMSTWWPKDNDRLNRAYPIEWARAIHFPTMLYFVAFTIVHVLLVFTTGALRNLNHMFAARPADDWLGFAFFAGSMLVVACALIAARPALLTPVASRFGTVSSR
ncbi:cytochrome b/b6 domain-containing protein [Agrococcus sp. Ld7]|uniref:cytochrome b/b6 domain-containing protein n=1 Tax=Agrococcus sp. Ld7 TaxID=649148 RepID=UPI00386446E1